ncbi:MAG: UDP-N-acetylmuramoyl-tripeptide--D-alanyl-D-alanine ligase, partial [Bacteroidia bacterium]|nr:UDP-N-acetylmuramoyl-tripeptide--D-alanyl-D-alanine ligase [Bacteroidia bacterium]
MKLSLKNSSTQLNATILGKTENQFSDLITDSRGGGNFGDSLFIAIKTNRNNGHRFIAQMYEKGVRSFLISEKEINTKDFPEAGFLLVENTLDALQKLATYKRSLFKKPVIAITGSNGKTIVKEWLNQLLQKDFVICRSPKSFNSQIGVPLSVWGLNENQTLAIFEAGISQPGEMEKLQKIILPTLGIITNIKAAHDEHFLNRLQKAQEKVKLFVGCEEIFYCSDHPEINEALNAEEFSEITKYSWGKNIEADLHIESIVKEILITKISGVYIGEKIQIQIPFTDEASIENAIHCWLYLLESGIGNAVIQERMKELAPVAMRLELKQAVNNCSVINDSYNSDIESLSIALDFLNRQQQHPKKTIILSDILQSGKKEIELYFEIGQLLKAKKIDRLIGIGESISKNESRFDCEKEFFPTTEAFLKNYSPSKFSNEAILLKGSRNFSFEKIGILLQQKSHDTVFEFSLNNLVHNLNYYRGLLKPGAGI